MIDMLVNGKALMEYGAMVLRDYNVEDCPVDNIIYKGRNRTGFAWLGGIIGLKTVHIEIAFFGHNRHEVLFNKSRFAGEIYGKCELFLPDGYWYTSVLQEVGEIEWIGEGGAIGTYEFQAQQHGRYEEASGGSIVCKSTIPKTDCILTFTVSTSYSDIDITMTQNGSQIAKFSGCNNADVLTFDGINKLVQKNGQNYAASVEFMSFPQLERGTNTFTPANNRLVVGYYPVYM